MQARAQLFQGDNYGFNIGLVSALGNRFQRLGITLQGYYCHDFLQANAEIRAYYNFRNLGPALHYNELVTSAGMVFGYGAQQTMHNPFLCTVSNQTRYTNSIGYSYNLYFNNIKTSQQTGIIALQFNTVSIITENDIFARPELDRFRTEALLVQYQYKNLYQFAVNCTMWTGQFGNRVTDDKEFPYGCHMDTIGGRYTSYSHGLLSGQFKMIPIEGQTLQGNLGIDAQSVRNFLQNRMVHDIVHKSRNCQIPVLDTAGQQYLYKPGQKMKPAQLYWNAFTGAATFY